MPRVLYAFACLFLLAAALTTLFFPEGEHPASTLVARAILGIGVLYSLGRLWFGDDG